MNVNSQVFPLIFEDKLKGSAKERENIGRVLSGQRAQELEQKPIEGDFNLDHLAKIHNHLFKDISSHAGVVREYGMVKGETPFAHPSQFSYLFDKELPDRIESLNRSVKDAEKYAEAMADLHSTLDLAHPFREGNGRATRIFMAQVAKTHHYDLDFSKIDKDRWVDACIHSIKTGNEQQKAPLFKKIVHALP